MIRGALLTLLADGAKYGYLLRSEFQAATGSAWRINTGQIYTTLSRMERDGVVKELGADSSGRPLYELTVEGRKELEQWLETSVERSIAARDEVSMKVILSAATGLVDPADTIAVQRQASMAKLQELTASKRVATNIADRLHYDRLLAQIKAEVQWLDIAEQTLTDKKSLQSLQEALQKATKNQGDKHE